MRDTICLNEATIKQFERDMLEAVELKMLGRYISTNVTRATMTGMFSLDNQASLIGQNNR